MNGVYQVSSTPTHKTIIVDYTGSVGFIPNLLDGSTADSYGNIYKFVSVRLSSMDNVNDLLKYSDYNDLVLETTTVSKREGDKVFADADSSGLWRVYEKQDPYTTKLRLSPDGSTADQDFGYQIIARNDGRTVVVSAPTKAQGEVHFLFRSSATAGTELQPQSTVTTTTGSDNTSKLGYSLSMSTDENFVVAGAPYANTTGSDGSTVFSDAGAIKIFVWDPSTFKYGTLVTRKPPTDVASQNFGWAHKICEPGADPVRSTAQKYMFVSAPGIGTDAGTV